MRTQRFFFALALLTFLSALNLQISACFAQSTAFTYQGQLDSGGAPANGSYDFTFTLFDSTNVPGMVIAGPVTNSATGVTNGLFTVAIDFGAGIFSGNNYWLEIGVQTNGGGGFATLSPRQPIMPVPQAIFANTASNVSGTISSEQLTGSIPAGQLSGTVSAAQLPAVVVTNGARDVNISGTFSGNGAGVTNIPFASVVGGEFSFSFPTFSSSSATFSVGSHPESVVAADVNGDGKPDLIAANSGDNTLTVLTNNGSGGFGSNATMNVDSEPDSVITADVNGDGNPDLIAANYLGGSLTVLTNGGSGGFGLSATLFIVSYPFSVAAADVNGDGKPDLISCDDGYSTLTVLTNNGSGVFSFNATLNVGNGPFAIAVADINGDGKPDLISANLGDSTLTVLTNNGSGHFGSNATLNADSPTSVVATDVNGDGQPDLVSADSSGNTLTVLTNNGSGVFGFNATLDVGSSPMSVVATDVNGDGQPDLVSANSSDNTLTVLTNNGSGVFSFNATLHVGGVPWSVAAADVNGDGKPDLISANSTDNTLTVLTQVPQLNVLAQTLAANNIAWSSGGLLSDNQGGSLELGNSLQSGDIPFIDFHYGAGTQQDYNVRLINDASNRLTLDGDFHVNGGISGNGSGLTNLNYNSITNPPVIPSTNGFVTAAITNGLATTNFVTSLGYITSANGGNAALATNVVPGIGITNGFLTGAFITNSIFAGDGSGLTNLNASQIFTGTLNPAQIPNLDASKITTGTISLSQLSGITSAQLSAAAWQSATNLNGGNATLASNLVSGISITNAFITNSIFAGDGAGLTNLNASQISSGILNPAQIPNLDASKIATGTFSGNGSGLTDLNATNLTGTVSAAQLPATVVTNTETGVTLSGTFSGNGGGLTNVSAASLGGTDIITNGNGVVLNTGFNANNHPIYLKSGDDVNHGLAASVAVTNFTPLNPPDGPILWGYDGGALGSMNNGAKLQLVWTTSGVGIGTTNPASALHVVSSSGDAEISVQSGDPGGRRWTIQSSSTNGGGQLPQSLQIIDRTIGVSRVLIDTNGNVGIGTSSPRATLSVGGNAIVSGNLTNSGNVIVGGDVRVKGNYAVSSAENLRIVRGNIASTGLIGFGSNFSVSHPSAGDYIITYTPGFASHPIFTATAYQGGALFPAIWINSSGSTEVRFYDASGTAADPSGFDFIAIGP